MPRRPSSSAPSASPVSLDGIDCLGYVRVSTERQAGEVYTSLADQERAIGALAAKLGRAVGAWFRDEGASGATVAKRPALRALIDACEATPRAAGAPGLVLVLNDSRFGRFPDPEEATYWRFHLARLGWVVRFVESDESENKTMRSIMRIVGSAQATEYRDNIRRNAKRGRKGSADQGFWGGRTPFGYRRKVVYPAGRERVLEHGVPKAKDEKVKLIPHEEEAAIVRELFERYATGVESLASLCKWAADQPGSAGRRWYTANMALVLANPAYMGDVVGGRRASTDQGPANRSAVAHESEWYGRPDAHPAVVSRAVFAAVQSRLATNRRATRAVQSPYLLSGLVTCTLCGSRYIGGGVGGYYRTTGPVEARGEKRARFYRCAGGLDPRRARVRCEGKIGTVTKHRLEAAVVDVLAREFGRPAVRREIVAEIDEALERAVDPAGETAERVSRELVQAEARRDRLVAAVARGTLTDREAGAQLTDVRAQIARLEAERSSIVFDAERARTIRSEREALVALALDFPRVLRELSGARLREHIRPWLKAATFDKETRMLTLEIRRLPAVAGAAGGGSSFDSSGMPARDGQEQGQKQVRERTVVRRVMLAAGRRPWWHVDEQGRPLRNRKRA